MGARGGCGQGLPGGGVMPESPMRTPTLEDRVDRLTHEVQRDLEDFRTQIGFALQGPKEPVLLAGHASDLKAAWDGVYRKMVELRVLARELKVQKGER